MKTQATQNHSHNGEKTSLDAIQRRAYELFVARGKKPGHEMEDWLQAENEMRHKHPQQAHAHQS